MTVLPCGPPTSVQRSKAHQAEILLKCHGRHRRSGSGDWVFQIWSTEPFAAVEHARDPDSLVEHMGNPECRRIYLPVFITHKVADMANMQTDMQRQMVMRPLSCVAFAVH
jgi:hypothetical protein